MFVLVTEDGMECKSEDDKRWNGILTSKFNLCSFFQLQFIQLYILYIDTIFENFLSGRCNTLQS